MRQAIKSALRPVSHLMRGFVKALVEAAFVMDRESFNQQTQRSIINQYQLFKLRKAVPYRHIRDAGFRAYSQFEEDGIILYVLSMIEFKTRRLVEICCGSGNECMAANLILNHGFDGYLFDASDSNIGLAESFFRSKKDCLLYLPTLKQAWITVENVNDLLRESGCAGEIDLLSLDLDGNEYWIWKAIDVVNPRLLVVETHNIIPANRSVTVDYRPDFCYLDQPKSDFRSASLLAMARLCKRRGYRLIGANRHGFNAFFLRNDEGTDFFPEVPVEETRDNHWSQWGENHRWPAVKDMPWVEVEQR
jgi:hypothetical protein